MLFLRIRKFSAAKARDTLPVLTAVKTAVKTAVRDTLPVLTAVKTGSVSREPTGRALLRKKHCHAMLFRLTAVMTGVCVAGAVMTAVKTAVKQCVVIYLLITICTNYVTSCVTICRSSTKFN